MPWLTGTAFLHSIMIQEKRGMLKVWNVSLMLATGTLAIMGTFLVRSGILNSIHAFGGSSLGVPFVTLIGVMIASALYLVVTRRSLLRSEHRLDSLLSRESVFLANNVVLVALCFVILWGTYFPLISEALTGQTQSVGPPWFDRYTVPLALILVLLSGVGPVIAWRRATLSNARRNLLVPATVSLLVLVALLAAGVSGSWRAIAMFACAAFVLGSVGQEFWRGVRVRRALAHESPPVALVSLVQRNRRRYGGYVVHIGIAILFIGVAASSSFQHESELSLGVGQSARVGPYTFRYVRSTASVLPGFDRTHTGSILDLGAVMDVSKGGRHVTTLYPSAGYYSSTDPTLGSVGSLIGGETVSHVGLDAGPLKDYWAAIQPDISAPPLQKIINAGNRIVPFSRPDEALIPIAFVARRYLSAPPPAQFHILVSPLVTWIWSGGVIVFLGALIAIWPAPGLVRRRVTVSTRAARRAFGARGLSRA